MMVSVNMLAYNHGKYIGQAIDSILMQKTNFDYEIIIGEDCSKDETRKIVLDYQEKYPDKIRLLLHKSNVGMMQNFTDTIKMCIGKYIALLEGDDFWSDPYKLQMQVEFLEKHDEFGLVHTDADVLFEKTGNIIKRYNFAKEWYIPEGYIFDELLPRMFIKTLTVMFRSALTKKYLEEVDSIHWTIGDHPLFIYISKFSKVKYFNYSTGVYRIIKKSATQHTSLEQKITFMEGLLNIEKYFAGKFGASDNTKRLVDINYHERNLQIAFYKSDFTRAKESYMFLKNQNKLLLKWQLMYFGTGISVIKEIILRILRLKKNIRILLNRN